jgi:hypothetical protein
MNSKGFCFLLGLAVITGMGISAQEKEGYIKPTFGVGISFFESDVNFTTLSLDVDFIASSGLTFGLQTYGAWNNNIGTYSLTAFVLGYTYTASKWSAGGKLLHIPFEELYGSIGFDVNGTLWVKEYFGLTGIMDVFYGLGPIDWRIYSIRIGISAKY